MQFLRSAYVKMGGERFETEKAGEERIASGRQIERKLTFLVSFHLRGRVKRRNDSNLQVWNTHSALIRHRERNGRNRGLLGRNSARGEGANNQRQPNFFRWHDQSIARKREGVIILTSAERRAFHYGSRQIGEKRSL